MVELGYMAKNIVSRPDWLAVPIVQDVVAVSNCVSTDFCDYINYWQHNGYWFFDSPKTIRRIATENNIDLSGSTLLYYRGYEKQFDAARNTWSAYLSDPDITTKVSAPKVAQLIGYDIVCYSMQNSPECSPLSCNHVARHVRVNPHCLIETLDSAIECLENGIFNSVEPGPFRIIAVHTADWCVGE